jgi:DNA-binding LytR/AlgR family response regulator
MVIFITSHSNYAVEGFNLNAIDFLVKPFTFERFEQAVKKANEQLILQTQNTLSDDKHFFIRADFSLIKVVIQDILYVEGLDDYVKIHLNNQKTIVARITMKSLLEKLPTKYFVRIHRSFIVAIDKIDRIKNKSVSVAGKELPMGLSYEANALKKLAK